MTVVRVLVVDDEPQILRFLKPSLGAAGYEVTTAANGADALKAAATQAPDIILLDLGADDYINKPFAMGELMARLRTALRHAKQQAGEVSMLTAGDLVIDLGAHSVSY